MFAPDFLKRSFEAALPYDRYLATGKPGERDAWTSFFDRVELSESQRRLLRGFTREINCLILSGAWCGDCVQQVPMLARLEEANPEKFRLRLIDRDDSTEIRDALKLCGGNRVPVGVLLNEDFDVLALVGDRSLNRYRAMAEKNLGPACPVPGAAVPEDEVRATLQDWVDEVERAHLMARLSTKLRQRHGD